MPMAARGLAKLAEECGELLQVVGKKLAYYNDAAVHPDGGPPLSQRLEDEMGDVFAAIEFVSERLGLDTARIDVRARAKLALFHAWDAKPDNNADAVDGGPVQHIQRLLKWEPCKECGVRHDPADTSGHRDLF